MAAIKVNKNIGFLVDERGNLVGSSNLRRQSSADHMQALGGRTLYEVGYRHGDVVYAITDTGTVLA